VKNVFVLCTAIVTAGYGAIGYLDDRMKIQRRDTGGLAGRFGVRELFGDLPVTVDRLVPLPQHLITFARLQKGQRLPAREVVQQFYPTVSPDGIFVVLLVKVRLADVPLRHGGCFCPPSVRRVDHPLVRGTRVVEAGLVGQATPHEVIRFILLAEAGVLFRQIFDQRVSRRPFPLLRENLRAPIASQVSSCPCVSRASCANCSAASANFSRR